MNEWDLTDLQLRSGELGTYESGKPQEHTGTLHKI